MRVLVACEESQAVTKEFRKLGHEAYSCDIIECSGGHPEWHIMQDVLPLLNGNCEFMSMDGQKHTIIGKWDLIIAHPPCTYLTVAANKLYNIEKYGEKAIKRLADRESAIEFFMAFVNADCDKKAIENPIGVISTRYRKPDQIIQPYQFGHPVRKSTCLWLYNLPPSNLQTLLTLSASNHKAKVVVIPDRVGSSRTKTARSFPTEIQELQGHGAKHIKASQKRWQSNGAVK